MKRVRVVFAVCPAAHPAVRIEVALVAPWGACLVREVARSACVAWSHVIERARVASGQALTSKRAGAALAPASNFGCRGFIIALLLHAINSNHRMQ